MEEESTPPSRERKPFQNFRSAASNNWRMKDDSPRVTSPQPPRRGDSEQQGQRFQRGHNDDEPQGYSSRPRNSYGAQPRERNDIPTEVATPRLYVGNLLYTAQSSDVESFFVTSGFSVANISMSVDQMTGRNPSYCFVDLDTVDEAKRALDELNGKELMGRSVRINPGVGRKDRDGQRDGPRTSAFNGVRSPVREGLTSPQGDTKPAGERWSRSDGPPQWSAKTPEQGKRLYVGGLPLIEPQVAVEAEMQSLIANLNLGVKIVTVSKLILPHPSKASEPGDHHYLFIDVGTTEDVDKAIEALDGAASPWSQDGQGRLKVNRAKENTGRKTNREQGDRPGFRDSQREGQGDRVFARPSWRDSAQ